MRTGGDALTSSPALAPAQVIADIRASEPFEERRAGDLVTEHRRFRDELFAAGLLVDAGADGLYARGEAFDRLTTGVRRAIDVAARRVHGGAATPLRFPPVFPRPSYEKTDYIASFPHLTGVVQVFEGDDAQHRALLTDREAGLPWDHHLSAGDTVLTSAACHPAFGTLSGSVLTPEGRLLDVDGWCFRHEPSPDPLRMQAFTMREYVVLGTPQQAVTHRETWVVDARKTLRDLGLPVVEVLASDPFFGRAGRLLVRGQRDSGLKTELVVRLYGDLDDGTALFSANLHLDHFGRPFEIRTTDGHTAHSACVGFGVERIALALLRTHGLDLGAWPSAVRAALDLGPETDWP